MDRPFASPDSPVVATAASRRTAALRGTDSTGVQTVGVAGARVWGQQRHIAEAISARPHHHVR